MDEKVESVKCEEYTVAQPEISNVSYVKENNNIAKTMNKHIHTWVFAFILGGFGVDRFTRGQIGIGICKLLFGWATLGIWPLVDWIIAITKSYGSAYSNVEELTFDSKGHYIN